MGSGTTYLLMRSACFTLHTDCLQACRTKIMSCLQILHLNAKSVYQDQSLTSHSKHSNTAEVSVTGLSSFRQAGLVFLGTGMMVEFLKHVGVRDRLNISVKTNTSWSAHSFRNSSLCTRLWWDVDCCDNAHVNFSLITTTVQVNRNRIALQHSYLHTNPYSPTASSRVVCSVRSVYRKRVCGLNGTVHYYRIQPGFGEKRTLQLLISCQKLMQAWKPSSLLSNGCTLASKILGREDPFGQDHSWCLAPPPFAQCLLQCLLLQRVARQQRVHLSPVLGSDSYSCHYYINIILYYIIVQYPSFKFN